METIDGWNKKKVFFPFGHKMHISDKLPQNVQKICTFFVPLINSYTQLILIGKSK